MRCLRFPPGVSDEQAAAVLLKGLTSWFLLRETYQVKRGDVLLIPAAAGGVGLIMSQWARSLGARVIGVVSTEEKARLARRNGCNQVLVGYARHGGPGAQAQSWPRRRRGLRRCRQGHAAAIARQPARARHDGELRQCFGCGAAVVAAGAGQARIALHHAHRRRATIWASPRRGAPVAASCSRLIKRRLIRVHVGQRYPLAAAAQAQRDLEARRTIGSTVLVP